MGHRARFVALVCVAPAVVGCGPHQPDYQEYECPAPIGRIVREDCSRSELRYDGTETSAKVSVGSAGAEGSYREKALREADDVIAALKEQRSGLCQDFNTCKLTVAEYREDKHCLESTFTAVVALRETAQKVESSSAMDLVDRISSLRASCRAGSKPTAPAPTTASTGPTPEPSKPAPAPPPADWVPGKFMGQAVGSVAENARKVESGSKFGFDVESACLLGAYIRKGKLIDMWRELVGDRQYVFIGGGSESASDVDLAIVDESGKVIASDTDDDATPVVKVTPPRTGKYGLRLALSESSSSGSFVAVAILHEGGYSIPAAKITQSFGRALQAAGTASDKIGSRGYSGLVFHEQDNWSFFGTVLKPNEASTFGGLALVTDPSVVIGGGDDAAGNTKLSVKSAANGQELGTDTDKLALVAVTPAAGQRYSVQVANAGGAAAGLYAVVVLDVQK